MSDVRDRCGRAKAAGRMLAVVATGDEPKLPMSLPNRFRNDGDHRNLPRILAGVLTLCFIFQFHFYSEIIKPIFHREIMYMKMENMHRICSF